MKSTSAAFVLLLLAVVPALLQAQRLPAPGALADAAAIGDLREMDSLINRGADPDQPDASGQTPLCYAVESGRTDLLARMLDTTVDPNLPGMNGRTPLMIAVAAAREDMVLKLLASGADPNVVSDYRLSESADPAMPVSALSIAVNRGDFAMARRLFSAGADPGRMISAGSGSYDPLNLPVVRVPLDAGIWQAMGDMRDSADSPDWDAVAGGGAMVLHRSARNNDWRTARDALDKQVDVNMADERGVTPLMAAAWHGHASMVSLFLQRGADPGARDRRGRGALSYAAAAGSIQCLEMLLSVPSFAEDYGSLPLDDISQSPVYHAIIFAEPVVFERLLEAGIEPDGIDGNGVNLLMLASWLGDLRAVAGLLPLMDGGARDGEGRTALAWAAAAFDRNRRADRESGIDRSAGDIYPLARLLAARTRNPDLYSTQPTKDMEIAGIDAAEAWTPNVYMDESGNPRPRYDGTEALRELNPSPVPQVPGDGDLTLYRIFRDEEPGIPAAD